MQQDAVDNDVTLKLLRQRLVLLEIAADGTGGKEADDQCKQLLNLCTEDPYLKEMQTTLLADPDGVQTFGKVRYVRDHVLELQPNSDRVVHLMDLQRTALTLLARIVSCVEKECESWKTGVQALAKAYAEEEKAKKRVEDKAKKDEAKREAAAAKAAARAEKRKRDQDEKAAAAASTAAAEEDGGDEDVDASKTRRRRTGAAANELSEQDPAVLRSLRVSPQLPPTYVVEDLASFVTQICTSPTTPAIMRFKKGMVKKVFSVSWLVELTVKSYVVGGSGG